MIITLENARSCYEEIIKRVKKNNGKIVIFVGFDIDSLCSLRILVSLLRSDHVRYEIIPVMNYDQLDSKLEELRKGHEQFGHPARDIKAFVMINCGGTRDMSKYWFCEESIEITCLMIDVHRPSHHNNIHIDRSIIIINDDHYDIENCPKDQDLNDLNEEEEEEDDKVEENYYGEKEEEQDEEVEDEDEDEIPQDDEEMDGDNINNINNLNNLKKEVDAENTPVKKKKRKIIKKKENLDTINEEDDEIDKLMGSNKPQKSKKSAEIDERLLKIKLRKKKRMMINRYYSGNYFGFPAAYILYKLASNLHREDSHILWMLIVAMTEHYLQSRINEKMYGQLYVECQNEVHRLFPSLENLNISETKNVKKEEQKQDDSAYKEESSKLDENKNDLSNVKVKTINRPKKTIIDEPDYKLYLFRHWNLFDSLVYSNYTLAHLETWKEHGKEEIKKLLTFIGVPLDEARQKYTFMKNEFKDEFKKKITIVAKNFDLKNLIFFSFVYQFDQKTQLSASDFVHCLSALLEYPFPLKNLEGSEFQEEDDEGSTGSTLNLENSEENTDNGINYTQDEKLMRSHHKYDTFWASYDFLSLKNVQMVRTTVDLAIKFQISLVQNGTLIIDKKAVSANKYYRYTVINSDLEDQRYFHHAISLEKLAIFTMDTHYSLRCNKHLPQKPFILAMLNKTTRTYLVAGILGNARSHDNEKNDFPVKFKICANKINAKFMLNSFNDCIVEIPQDDYMAFMEEICQVSSV